MRRDERVRAALDGYIASDEPGTTHADAMGLALDAALADLGGLDGLEGADGLLARDEADRALVRAESAAAHNLAALRADRDRLRDALSALHRASKAYWLDWRQRDETLEAALATAYAAFLERRRQRGRDVSDHQHRWRRTAHLDACHYSSNHLACRCGAMAVTLTERDLADGYAASWGDPEDCERCRALAGGATPIHHVFIRAADGTVERDTSEPLTADSEAGR